MGRGVLGLADRLDAPEPLSAAAVSRVRELLTDGTGPLYCGHPRRLLDQTIWWIADAMQECPPHDWRCPVVSKLHPYELAWTCALCGATALSDDRTTVPDDAGRPS